MTSTAFADPDRLILRHRRQDARVYRTPGYRFYVLTWDDFGEPVPSELMTWWEFDAAGFERDPDWERVDEDWRLT